MIDEQTLKLLELVLKPINGRLDTQDDLLKDILRQGRATNGTLIDHASRLERIEDGDRSERKRHHRRMERRWSWVEVVVGGSFLLLSGAFGSWLLHAIGVVHG